MNAKPLVVAAVLLVAGLTITPTNAQAAPEGPHNLIAVGDADNIALTWEHGSRKDDLIRYRACRGPSPGTEVCYHDAGTGSSAKPYFLTDCPTGDVCYFTIRASYIGGTYLYSNEASNARDDPCDMAYDCTAPGLPTAPQPPSIPVPDTGTTVTVIPGTGEVPTAVRTVGRPLRVVEQVDTALIIFGPGGEPEVVPIGLDNPCAEADCPEPCDYLCGSELDPCDYSTAVPGCGPSPVLCQQPVVKDVPPCKPGPPPPPVCPDGAADCACDTLGALGDFAFYPCGGEQPCSPAAECLPCDPSNILSPATASSSATEQQDCSVEVCEGGGTSCLTDEIPCGLAGKPSCQDYLCKGDTCDVEVCEGGGTRCITDLINAEVCEGGGYDCLTDYINGVEVCDGGGYRCLTDYIDNLEVCDGGGYSCVTDLINAEVCDGGGYGCVTDYINGIEVCENGGYQCLVPGTIDLPECNQASATYQPPKPGCLGSFDVIFSRVQSDMTSLSISVHDADELVWEGAVENVDGDHAILEDVPVVLTGEYSLSVAQAGETVLRVIDPLFKQADLPPPPEWTQARASSNEQCYSNHTGFTEESMETGKNTYAGEYYTGGGPGQRRFMVAGWYNKWYYRDTCGYGGYGVGQHDAKAGIEGRYDIDVGETHTVTNLVGFSGSSDGECRNYGSPYGIKCHGHEVHTRNPTVFINKPKEPGIHQRGVSLFDEDPGMTCQAYHNDWVDLGVDLILEAFTSLTFLRPVQLIYGFVPDEVCQVPYDQVYGSQFSSNPGLGIKYNKDAFTTDQKVQAGGISTTYTQAYPHEIAMDVEVSVEVDANMNACDFCGWVRMKDTTGMLGSPTVKVEER